MPDRLPSLRGFKTSRVLNDGKESGVVALLGTFPGCDKRFAQEYNLKTHMRSHDNATPAPPPRGCTASAFGAMYVWKKTTAGTAAAAASPARPAKAAAALKLTATSATARETPAWWQHPKASSAAAL